MKDIKRGYRLLINTFQQCWKDGKVPSLRVILFSLLFLLPLSYSPCIAAPALQKYYDNQPIAPRQLSLHSIDKYKNDKAFDYKEAPKGESLFQKFMGWLRRQFNFKPEKGQQLNDNFFIEHFWDILFGLTMIFVIYMLFKNGLYGIFRRKPKSAAIKISTVEEDINTIDFAKLIEEAVKGSQYRYAVRLFYLKTLKELNDRQMINWKLDKTNRDYLSELAASQHYRGFEGLTDMFNWVWYGDFPVDEAYYNRASHEFNLFQQQLKAARP